MRVLITGVGGFAGSHLAEAVQTEWPEAEVWGCDLTDQRRPFMAPALKLLAADLRDPLAAAAVLEQSRPDRIYHLAGQAFVGESWENPWATLETNLRAQLNLLEATVRLCPAARFLALGSAEEYGRVLPADLPIGETQPLRPDSPYGVSKVGQDLLGLQYHLGRGLHVVRVRAFNHIGPRQNCKFVAPAFAAQIAAIEAGRQPPVLRVGNLQVRRDFTDVRDMVRGYILALERGRAGEAYNLGAGQSHSIQAMLDILLGLARGPIAVEVDPARLRPADIPDLVCDATKFRADTGWAPQITFEQTLQDLLEYERRQGRAAG